MTSHNEATLVWTKAEDLIGGVKFFLKSTDVQKNSYTGDFMGINVNQKEKRFIIELSIIAIVLLVVTDIALAAL